MTNALTVADLVTMRAAQTQSLQDTCVVQTWSAAADTHGQLIASYADGAAIVCRFVPSSGAEAQRPDSTIVTMPAMVRLPLGTVFTTKDRIKVTKILAETLSTPLVFGIDDAGTIGPTALTVRLKDVD